jgi:PleD family two-component response regulator
MMIHTPTLHGQTILVVDGATLAAAELSNRLTWLGAKVHVASDPVSAARYAECKRFDLALVGFSSCEGSSKLMKTLERRGVPYVSCASSSKLEHVDYSHVFSLELQPAA